MNWLRDTATIPEALFTLSVFVILIWGAKRNLPSSSPIRKRLLWFGCLVYCLFAFCDGDYFHYKQGFLDYKEGYELYSLEEIYLKILEFSPFYLIFRLIVWGMALLLLYFSAKLLGVWNSIFIYCFVSFSLVLFSYARVSLAVAIAVLGLSMILTRKSFNIIIGLCLCFCSYFFHKSVFIILCFLPFVGIPIGKKQAIFLICSIPILIYIINQFLVDYILTLEIGEKQQNVVNSYILSGNHADDSGPGRILLDILAQIPAYLSLFLMGQSVIYNSGGPYLKYFFSWTFLIFLVATTFVTFPYTRVLYYRIMFMGRIPAMMGVALKLSEPQLRKPIGIKVFFYSAIIYDVAKQLYSLYISILQ